MDGYLTDEVKVGDIGGNVAHGRATRTVKRLDTDSCSDELVLGRELGVQSSAQFLQQLQVVGRVLRREHIAWGSLASRVLPIIINAKKDC